MKKSIISLAIGTLMVSMLFVGNPSTADAAMYIFKPTGTNTGVECVFISTANPALAFVKHHIRGASRWAHFKSLTVTTYDGATAYYCTTYDFIAKCNLKMRITPVLSFFPGYGHINVIGTGIDYEVVIPEQNDLLVKIY